MLPNQAWVADLSAYVKQLAPRQLVMLGAWGFFGVSTPALLQENPWDLVVAKLTDMVVFSEDPACNGEYFSAITALPDIDLASMHVYPEYWSICTACALSPLILSLAHVMLLGSESGKCRVLCCNLHAAWCQCEWGMSTS
jgi:hypothetical protein